MGEPHFLLASEQSRFFLYFQVVTNLGLQPLQAYNFFVFRAGPNYFLSSRPGLVPDPPLKGIHISYNIFKHEEK